MKSVLVIGGNSDIGFAIARAFAENNYDINLASRNTESLEKKKKYSRKIINLSVI